METPKGRGRKRQSKNTITTKSGNTLKINQSISDRNKARKATRAAAKATYLSTLPKDRIKRVLHRLQPKRVAAYWFSREGGIMALKITGISIIAVFFMTIGLFAFFRKDLPNIKDISGKKLGGSMTYYDRTGQTVLWQDYDAIKRIPVKDEQISKYMKQATIAIEDKDFYKHGAFDTRGIMRAAFNDVTGAGPVQGGSTITQQLVKLNEKWTDNRTVTRKVKELILATELEREYSKDEVLTGYLNMAPYGGVEYGVESASRDYFQTSAKNLTLEQATMLASIPQSPSYYSPYAGSKYNPAVTGDTFAPEALLNRQHYILDQMVKQGYIKKDQAAAAKKVDILAQIKMQAPKYQGIKAPYFVLAAKHQLLQTYGANTVQRGGNVITTLNLDLQNKAEELIAANLRNITRYGADEEAMVNEEVATGQIVSLVGGTDFTNEDHGQDNFAAGILLPPGSSFKPYDYAALIDNNNNVGAGSVLYDTKGKLPGYDGTCPYPPTLRHPCPEGTTANLYDYDFKFPGPITLRYAMGGSRNVPAVKSMLSAVPNDKSPGKVNSINKTINTASAMMANSYDQSKKRTSYNCYGDEALTKTTQCYGASAIGDGAFLHLDDHVNGLSTLGRLGQAIPRTYILKVTDSGNKTVYEWKQPKPKQVIKADTAFIVNNMASDPKASYLPGSCTDTNCTALGRGGYKFQRFNGWQLAVKTGTTNDGYDGLMTSWSKKYATVSWVGHHTRNVTLRTSMEALTEPLTRGWMEYAHQNVKADNWTQPTTVKTAPAYVVRSHVALGSIEPSPTNDLYPGHYIGGGTASKNNSQTLDRVSNKVATSCTPAAAKQTVGNANVASWNIDQFNGGRANIGSGSSSGSTTANATDDVHNCSDSPPTVTLTAPDTCDTSCTITATITQGTHPLSAPERPDFPGTVTFTLAGQVIHTAGITDSPSSVSFTYTPTATGSGPLVATVTDSVLYSGSQSTTLNFTVPVVPTTEALTITSASTSGTNTTISWTGGSGSYTVFKVGGGAICGPTTSLTCVASIAQAHNGDQVYVKDTSDHQSANSTVN